MAETIFTQSSNNPLLYVNNGAGVSWSAFLLPAAIEPVAETYSLSEAWDLQTAVSPVFGYFLFSQTSPINLDDFLENAINYFTSLGRQFGAYIAWFKDPNTAPSSNNTYLLKADASGSSIIVEQDLSLLFGDYLELFISGGGNAGVNLAINSEGNTLRLRYFENFSQIKFAPKSNPGISTVDFEITLPFDGDLRACFQVPFSLKANQVAYNSFDIALKYFFSKDDSIIELSYPIFSDYLNGWSIRFIASLDFWDQLNKNYDPLTQAGDLRTYLAFDGMVDNSGRGSNIAIPAQSLTDYAMAMTMLPNIVYTTDAYRIIEPSGSMLVFSPREADSRQRHYLVPQGNFHLGFSPDATPGTTINGQYNLLCGISGTETISFTPASAEEGQSYIGDIVSFYSGQAAYAPVFPFPEVNLFDPPDYEGEPLLNKRFQTAWANIIPAEDIGNLYSSQPEGSLLFAKESEVYQQTEEFLGFFEPSLILPGNLGFCFPMVAYQGIDTSEEEDFNEYEFQIILPSRKAIISKQSTASVQSSYRFNNPNLEENTEPTSATTNQGLLLTIDTEGAWSELLLAQNEVLGQLFQLQFTELETPLKNAFQTNQQFLVITDNTYLGTLSSQGDIPEGVAGFYNKMSIQEWAFEINTGIDNLYGDYRNVLIFKFCDGSLRDRVNNPQDWTEASNFNATENNGLTAVSQWLQEYIASAEQQYLEFKNPYFKKFFDIVNNPNWSGILALKVDLNLQELPTEIQGLLAGIDLSNFFGHHLGIEVSRVDASDDLKMEGVSSLFGLIDYNDKVYAQQIKAGEDPDKAVPPDGNTYDFKVLTLQVLFENTNIKDFYSKAQLTMNELFSDTVINVPNGQRSSLFSTVVYNGTYEDQDGESTYSFNVVNPGQRLFFDNNILSYCSLSKSQFNTLVRQGESGSTSVQTRFLLWGFLHFEPIPDFDIFSFGAEEGYQQEGQGYGLYYSNLYISMDFYLETPTVRNFAFNATEVSFDPQQSSSRERSLFPNFALKLNKLVLGSEDKHPNDLGFLPVGVELNSRKLEGDWYGLEMEVNMGGPGALVSAAGFDSTMMLAWSPGGKLGSRSYNAYVGIKLPGTSNDAKLLSLQGVLKVGIGDIFMQYYEEGNYFSLRMSDVNLKLLGIAKLPPNGYINFFIFGNPNADGKRENLGWYAAYNKDEQPVSTDPAISDTTTLLDSSCEPE